MEKDNAAAIAYSFQRTLELVPFKINPLDTDRIQKVLECTFIPQETKRMHFNVPSEVMDGEDNINKQYKGLRSDMPPINLIIRQVMTNEPSDYSPTLPVRLVRKIKEKQFLEHPAQCPLEVLCRVVRNTPLLQEMSEQSLKKGFRYSAIGYLEILYSSEHAGMLWTKLPLISIPGNYSGEEQKDREIANRIFKFGLNYQNPDQQFLKSNGYKTNLTRKREPYAIEL